MPTSPFIITKVVLALFNNKKERSKVKLSSLRGNSCQLKVIFMVFWRDIFYLKSKVIKAINVIGLEIKASMI